MQTRIVVLGAGYAGLLATLRLAGKTKRKSVAITLIDARDAFVPRIQLHQVVTNQPVTTRPLTPMLTRRGVNFIQAWVTQLKPESNTITYKTDAGEQDIAYDHLVYALGSRIDRTTVPGVMEHAYTLDLLGEQSVNALRERLTQLSEQGGRVVICGGGPTGIEAATEIKDVYPNLQVSVYTANRYGLLKGKESVQSDLKRGTEKLGVAVHEFAPVGAVEAQQIVLADGRQVPFDVCIWAGGFHALPLAKDAAITVNQHNQILVDAYGQSISHPSIIAVGDAAHSVQQPGAELRMSVYGAVVTGLHAANNLYAQLHNKRKSPLSFAYMGQGVGLGRRRAVGFLSFPDDTPKYPLVFKGRVGFYVRAFFVWFLNMLIPLEQHFPGTFYWFGRRRYKRFQQPSTLRPQQRQSS